MNASSYSLLNEIIEEDSDEEDLEKYTDVGLKGQLYITLSRIIQTSFDTGTKIYQLEHTNKVRQTVIDPKQHTLNTHISATNPQRATSMNAQQYDIRFRCIDDQLLPDFEHLHQTFAQQFSKNIFNNHLVSLHLQRAFKTITPQDIGLTDYSFSQINNSNMRTRRRAVFDCDNKAYKGFVDDAVSFYNIPNIQRERKLIEYMQSKKRQSNHKHTKTKPWQNIFNLSIRSRKQRESLTLDDPSIIDIINIPKLAQSETTPTSKDDMLVNSEEKQSSHISNKTLFEVNKITHTIDSNKLQRGDLIFIMDYEMIDIQNEDLNSFVKKYKLEQFLKIMNQKDMQRRSTVMQQIETIRKRSSKTSQLNLRPKHHRFMTAVSADNVDSLYEMPIETRSRGYDSFSCRPRSNTYLFDEDREMKANELEIFKNYNKMGAAHCMIVLQTIGVSVEVAHVTSHGAVRSFIRQFDAESVAKSLYLQSDENEDNKFEQEQNLCMFGAGPPMVYRCVVYRLNTHFTASKQLANEAANVAENLIQNGKVLCDPKLFGCCMDRYFVNGNPEKYFDKFLLHNDESLFRRTARLKFDEGTQFLNLSSSEFIALCFQRALVNKKSFDRQLIRILDLAPQVTPPALMQKYIHLNIDAFGDWKCLGNIFYSYL